MSEVEIKKMEEYWEKHAQRDPLWAILSAPDKKNRQWHADHFFETGRREISILMHHLRDLQIQFAHGKALDFGCGVGRLTQAMALFFDQVCGIDISESMVRFANSFNHFPEKVQYICNQRNDLLVFPSGEFDFVYSNIVLQHVHPDITLAYLSEFLRVLRPGGLLIFQLPSHKKNSSELRTDAVPLETNAYQYQFQFSSTLERRQKPETEINVPVIVKNISRLDWVSQENAPIRMGNHWLSGDGKEMLIQDDGRSVLPYMLKAGESILVNLKIKTPAEVGQYICEIDLVQESVTWFKDRGAMTARFGIEIIESLNGFGSITGKSSISEKQVPKNVAEEIRRCNEILQKIYKQLPKRGDEPGEFPMYGIEKENLLHFIKKRGDATLVFANPDEHGGKEWSGYLYCLRKNG